MSDLGGRPRKEIDFEQFEKLCSIECTKEEVCAYFDIDDKTLEARLKEQYQAGFSEVYRSKKKRGRISLRRKQYEVALSGNPSMLIWLGKNYLSQTDKIKEDTTVKSKIDASNTFIWQVVASDKKKEEFYDP